MGISYHIYENIDQVKDEWHLTCEDSIFMSPEFYKSLEEAPPSGTTFYYVLVRDSNKTIGLFYYQLKKIELDRSLRLHDQKASNFWTKVLLNLKKLLSRRVRAYTLVAGNMTLTGTYGQWLEDQYLDNKWEMLATASDQLFLYLKDKGIRVRAILLKDYYSSNRPLIAPKNYTEFIVQPNMILELNPNWNTFDDYLGAMKSKYRTRVKRARKKSYHLVKFNLSLDDIKKHEKQIKRLYKNVADGAGFNLFTLPDDYFWSLKKYLGDNMKVTGYFDENQNMVGFFTSIKNSIDLDAHFLGYDVICNTKCQLYLNMLYDLIEEAIENKAKKLIMSRTALEIKSSVGAEPHEMFLFMKIPNTFLNSILPRALNYFVPKVDWKPRSPFPKT